MTCLLELALKDRACNPGTMKAKTVAVLTVFCIIAVIAVQSEQMDGATDSDYISQLDSNGQAVYDVVTFRFANEINGANPQTTVQITVMLTNPVLFEDEESSTVYVEGIVNDALAAIYYTNAEAIWLWDLPVTSVEVVVRCDSVTISSSETGTETGSYITPTMVTFALTIPSDFISEDGSGNTAMEALNAIRDARIQVSGTVPEKVQAIAGFLYGITVADDKEDTVSNVYDALVTGSSSSAGIAAAFTYLCAFNDVTAQTVKGTVVTGTAGTTSAGYWNVVLYTDSDADIWYFVDVTQYNRDDRAPLLAGMSTLILLPSADAYHGFGSTHVVDLNLASSNSLSVPSVPAEGYAWPDDRTFFERWGT